MNRYSFFLLCSLLFLSSQYSHANDSSSHKEVITAGFFPEDYPPLYWHNNKQGIIQLVLAEVSKNSRFIFKIKRYPFNRLIQQVASGNLDMEPWTSPDWRQSVKDKVYFTEPFTQHCETMVFKKHASFIIKKPGQLISKRIGTVQDFTFPSYEKLFQKGLIHRISGSDEEGVLQMLSLGRSDLAFMDRTVADYLIKEKYSKTLETKNIFGCAPITFMFKKTKSRIGKEISDILQTLKERHIIEKIKQSFN